MGSGLGQTSAFPYRPARSFRLDNHRLNILSNDEL